MIIPIITAMSRDVLRAVPGRSGGHAGAGATRWETIRKAVLPYGRSGLVGAIMLGLGARWVSHGGHHGHRKRLPADGLALLAGHDVASKLASDFGESSGLSLNALIELALILFVITLLVNVVARLLVWRMTRIRAGRD